MKKNRYVFNYNSDNYIIGLYTVKDDNYDYEGQISGIPDICKGWYKYENGMFIADEDRKNTIIQENAKQTEIDSLKNSLADSDYIIAETFENVLALNNPLTFVADFIKILVQFNSKYADVIANRKLWRDRIEELSK